MTSSEENKENTEWKLIAIPESSSEDHTTCLLLALFLSVVLLLALIRPPHNVPLPLSSENLHLFYSDVSYFYLPWQASTCPTIPPLSKHGVSVSCSWSHAWRGVPPHTSRVLPAPLMLYKKTKLPRWGSTVSLHVTTK